MSMFFAIDLAEPSTIVKFTMSVWKLPKPKKLIGPCIGSGDNQ